MRVAVFPVGFAGGATEGAEPDEHGWPVGEAFGYLEDGFVDFVEPVVGVFGGGACELVCG
jgi:hypothetical protein